MPRRASAWDLLSLNAGWVGLAFMWNSLQSILLPAVLLHYVADERKNTILGLLTGAGLIIAMIIQPIAGALSDRWRSRWGRRRPLIVLGLLLDFVFLGILAYAAGVPALALGYLGLQFSNNLAHGPMQGLLPDRVPPDELGRGSGLKNVFDIAGMIAALLLMGRLFSPEETHLQGAIGVVFAVLAVSTGLTLLGAHEESSEHLPPGRGLGEALKAMGRIDWHKNAAFVWLVAVRLVFFLGVYGIQAFAQYYLRDVLGAPDFVRLTGDLLAAIVLGILVFSFIAGFLSDRLGSRPLHIAAAALAAVGSLLLLLARTPGAVLIFGGVLGAGVGVFLTANWALLNQLAPPEEAGKFMGLTNIATAGGGAVARLFGPAIDGLNLLRPGANLGYSFLFVSAAVFAVVSALMLRQVAAPQKSR
jgi:MFS family permease